MRANPTVGGIVKQFIAALLLAWMPVAMSAEPMEDVDCVLIPPQPVLAPGRIEVIEFFYYGCESCKRRRSGRNDLSGVCRYAADLEKSLSHAFPDGCRGGGLENSQRNRRA